MRYRYEDAMQHFQLALKIRLKILGAEHTLTADTYHYIGNVFQCQGKYEDALKQFQKELQIKLKALGTEHVSTAGTYSYIGEFLFDLCLLFKIPPCC